MGVECRNSVPVAEPPMPWLELRFIVAEREAEAFSEGLMDAGALSVSVEDADANTVD